jgi:cyclopropane fatty-acyl-phospholipid synthase-like methyltransferase
MTEEEFNALSYEEQCAHATEMLRRNGYPVPESATALQAPATAPAPVDRVRAIIEAPEAVGREQTARHLAFNTSLSAADALALLRASPDPNAAAPGPVMSELETWAATVAAQNGKRPFPQGHVPPARKAPVGPQEPQQALVRVYPPAARLAPTKPAASWANVIGRMNGSAA